MRGHRQHIEEIAALLSGYAVIFLLTFFASNTDYTSDHRLSFLIAQSFLESGTVQLNAYEGQTLVGDPWERYLRSKQILNYNGRYYSYSTVGSALLSTP